MSDVMLSIPFLVLSTKINPWGEVEKHVLTPFGDVDITVCAVSTPGAGGMTLDVQVGEGVDCWMMADLPVLQFRNALVEFVGGMVQKLLSDALLDISQLRIQFPGAEQKVFVPGSLENPSSSMMEPMS